MNDLPNAIYVRLASFGKSAEACSSSFLPTAVESHGRLDLMVPISPSRSCGCKNTPKKERLVNSRNQLGPLCSQIPRLYPMLLSHIAHQVRYFFPNPSLSNSALLAHAHLHISAALLARLLDLHIPHVLLAHSSALISNPLDVLSARFQQELHNIALVRALGLEHRKVSGFVLGPHVGACAHELLDNGEVTVQGGPV
jgi:hypothetical protein